MTDQTEIAVRAPLVVPITGEVLEPTAENATVVIAAAQGVKRSMDAAIREAKDVLIEESKRLGTKTLRTQAGTAVLSGGPTTEIDGQQLELLLAEAGCPEERIREAVKTEVTYKVDRAVLRQLAAANEDYRAAIELCTVTVEKSWTVKTS